MGADYQGCLIVSVRQGADLYRRIEGWVGAIMAEAQGPQQDQVSNLSELPGEDSNLR